MNKRLIATIITAATIVLVLATVFQSEFNNTPNQQTPTPMPTPTPITDVHISNFQFTQFFPAEGLSWHCGFSIEITNNETQRVDGLSLFFNTQSPYNINRTVGFYNQTYPYNETTILPQKICGDGTTMLLGSFRAGRNKDTSWLYTKQLR